MLLSPAYHRSGECHSSVMSTSCPVFWTWMFAWSSAENSPILSRMVLLHWWQYITCTILLPHSSWYFLSMSAPSGKWGAFVGSLRCLSFCIWRMCDVVFLFRQSLFFISLRWFAISCPMM